MAKGTEALNLFRALEKEGLRHLIVGDMAVVLYGVERATFDIDIAISPNIEDAKRLMGILKKAGYSRAVDPDTGKKIGALDEVGAEEILKFESVRVTDGQSVDILVVPLGTFDFMWEYHVEVSYKGAKILVPSILDLIHLKEQSGRPIDLEDARKLRHILRSKKR
jgi:hypothetical protein